MRKTKENGITLVALVITVIILLILAGITISQLTGSGLFENAKLAEQKSKNAQEQEEGILSDYENKIGQYVDGTRNTNYNNYSTNEVEIGTWIDGKKLYRKVINATNLTVPSNTEYAYDVSKLLDNSNIEVANFYGGYYIDYGSTAQQFHPFGYENNGYSYSVYYRQATSEIRIYGAWGKNAEATISKAYFIIEYTKK